MTERYICEKTGKSCKRLDRIIRPYVDMFGGNLAEELFKCGELKTYGDMCIEEATYVSLGKSIGFQMAKEIVGDVSKDECNCENDETLKMAPLDSKED